MSYICGTHRVASQSAWILPEIHEEAPEVVVRFDRSCRLWPQGSANAAFSQLLGDICQRDSLLVVTDSSFDSATQLAGWGFIVYSKGAVIVQGAGAHKVYTSSTRMELEAI